MPATLLSIPEMPISRARVASALLRAPTIPAASEANRRLLEWASRFQ
jgi:hypothetical protein